MKKWGGTIRYSSPQSKNWGGGACPHPPPRIDALAAVAFKRQMLGEGMEWDFDKVVMREHIRVSMANEYPEDFGTPAMTEPDKNIDHMTKEEYQKYVLMYNLYNLFSYN